MTFVATPTSYCQVLQATGGTYLQFAFKVNSVTGVCTVAATQAGNSLFNAAPNVIQNLSWVKTAMTISTTPLSNLPVTSTGTIIASYLASTPALNSGLTALNQLITVTTSTPTVCAVASAVQITTSGGMPTQVQVKGLKPGICDLSFNVPSTWDRTSAIATAIFSVR